jgi:hypothetical protein
MSDRDSDNQEKEKKKVKFNSRFARAVLFYVENEYEIVIEEKSIEIQRAALKLLKELKAGGNNVPNTAHVIAYNIPL